MKSMPKSKCDLHVHTVYSPDSTISPRMLVREAIALGFNAIAVTDHNTFQGALEAKRLAKSLGREILVLTGIELLTDEGEVILLSHNPLERLPRRLEEAIDYALEEDATVIIPHPYDRWRRGVGDLIYEVKAHAIEVFNPWASPRNNRRALAAARELGRAMTASSDAHSPEYLGCAYTLIDVDSEDEEGIHRAIREGRTTPVGGYPSMSRRIISRAKKVLRKTKIYREEHYWDEEP